MIFVCDISMLIHKLFHKSTPKDDVPEWIRNKLERIREHYSQEYDVRAFVCAFDNPARKLWKTELLYSFSDKEYKGGREKDPQIPVIEETMIECVGLDADWQCHVAPLMYEADDVIASIAKQYPGRVLVYSEDRDCHSLLESGRVGIVKDISYEFIGGRMKCINFNEQRLREKYGFGPESWIDYQAMVGVKDNVPGWEGVGEKKAKQVIEMGLDLRRINVECPDLKLNKRQKESYELFQWQYPSIRAVRAPIESLTVPVELKERVGV